MIDRAKEVISMVEKHTSVSYERMNQRSRKGEVLEARQIAMYALRKYTVLGYGTIASMFGGYDHSTVIHSCRKIQGYLDIGDKRFNFLNDFWCEKEKWKRVESSMISQLHNIELVDMAIHNIGTGSSSRALAYLRELQARLALNNENKSLSLTN